MNDPARTTPEATDVVVIGAGMGGLTAAALLARAGLSVCVLEADARPGGYLAGFERGRFVFDSAIHWLNACGPGGSVRRVLDFLGPDAPATPPLGSIRRYRGDGFDYLLTADPDRLRDRLIAEHPEQREGVAAFFAAARLIGQVFVDMNDHLRSNETRGLLERATAGMALGKVTLPFLRYVRWSTEDAFETLFPAPCLRRMFASEARLLSCLTQVGWAYTGDYQIPPAGGSREFPRFLCRSIEADGGVVLLRHPALRVLVEDRRATGVVTRRGKKGAEQTIRARWVLAACDLEALYERMLPEGAVPPSLIARIHEAELYESSVTVSLGLDVPPQDIGFGEELVQLTRDDVPRAEQVSSDPHKAAISVIAPSLRDPTLAPPGKGTLTILTMAHIDWGDRWKTGDGFARGAEYKAFKQAYADVLIDRVVEALSPSLREHIELIDVATPVTHWRYTGNRDGSIMAARPSRANFRNKVAHYQTPVKNLLLAGQWAELGGGVPVAVRAGTNAALIVLRREKSPAFEGIAAAVDGRDP
jgi:phytoene dehydrogenase-like protein